MPVRRGRLKPVYDPQSKSSRTHGGHRLMSTPCPVFAKITLLRRGPRSVKQTGDVPPYLYLRPRGPFNVAQRKGEPAGRETKSNVYFATPGTPPAVWTNYRNIETLGRDDKVRFAFLLTGAALRHGASNVIFANTGHGVDINR